MPVTDKRTSGNTVLVWERVLRSNPADLWAVLTDFPRMHEWFPGVRRMAVAAPPAAGVERTLTLISGQSHRERIGVWDPPRAYTVEVLEPPPFTRDWLASIRLEPVGDRVRLLWSLHYATRFGPVGRLVDVLVLRPVLATAFRAGLRRLQARVESR